MKVIAGSAILLSGNRQVALSDLTINPQGLKGYVLRFSNGLGHVKIFISPEALGAVKQLAEKVFRSERVKTLQELRDKLEEVCGGYSDQESVE